jgi:hypothetical protein
MQRIVHTDHPINRRWRCKGPEDKYSRPSCCDCHWYSTARIHSRQQNALNRISIRICYADRTMHNDLNHLQSAGSGKFSEFNSLSGSSREHDISTMKGYKWTCRSTPCVTRDLVVGRHWSRTNSLSFLYSQAFWLSQK